MTTKPKILVLRSEGSNCDEEAVFACNLAGGKTKLVHVNQLRDKDEKLKDYNILVLPGGFSYGDDLASGKILANELTSFFSEELRKFISRQNTAIFGICNGFQVLVRTGLLPFNTIGKMHATLTNNASGHFECRWIRVKVDEDTKCKFLQGLKYHTFSYAVAHGEGQFFASAEILARIEEQNLVAFRYIDDMGTITQSYPQNPNGSLNAIAGICDPSGRILGMMPHPERFVRFEQHPNWRRLTIAKPHGQPFFEHLIEFVKQA